MGLEVAGLQTDTGHVRFLKQYQVERRTQECWTLQAVRGRWWGCKGSRQAGAGGSDADV